jgi:sigma-E factor negative regulatory protein RseC
MVIHPPELVTIRAVVRKLEGNNALVEVEQGGCGRCHEEGGCGGQHLTQMFCGGQKTWLARNDIGAVVGDSVRVAIAQSSLRKTVNLVYGLPLLACIAGALGGMLIAGNGGAVIGAAGGLLISYIGLRLDARTTTGNPEDHPHIVSHY